MTKRPRGTVLTNYERDARAGRLRRGDADDADTLAADLDDVVAPQLRRGRPGSAEIAAELADKSGPRRPLLA
jgi:hypothetical protein